jgi:hypothetical protein
MGLGGLSKLTSLPTHLQGLINHYGNQSTVLEQIQLYGWQICVLQLKSFCAEQSEALLSRLSQ